MQNGEIGQSMPEMDPEQVQLLKMQQMRKLGQLLLRRHILFLALLFLLCMGGIAGAFYWCNLRSPQRFSVELELLFQPKESEHFKSIDDQAMLQLFSRDIVQKRTALELRKQNGGNLSSGDVEIRLKRNRRHLFSIIAYGNTEEDAVRKANMFARNCKEKYRSFRLADLDNWADAIRQQRNSLEEKIQAASTEMVRLARNIGLTDFESEQARLRQLVGEQEQALSAMLVRQANTAARKLKLFADLKNVEPSALRHAAKIRNFQESLKMIDDELLVQSQLYTDSNPKLLALKARRDAAQKNYDAFLKQEQIRDFTPDKLDAAEKLQKKLEEIVSEDEAQTGSLRLLRAELQENRESLQKLAELQPRMNQLKLLRDSRLKNMEDMERRLTDLNYLKTSTGSELQPLEHASEAIREGAFNKKKVAVMLLFSVFVTGACAVLLLIIQLMTGKIRNYEELECYYGLIPLGVLPCSQKSYSGSNAGLYALGEIYYRFNELQPDARRIFVGHLNGSQLPPELAETMTCLANFNGKKEICIDVVASHSFQEPSGMKLLNSVFYTGSRGVLPVENPYTLSGAELNLVREDLKILDGEYDAIVITRNSDLSRSGLLFRQMFSLCDAAVILVDPEKTTRKMLRYALSIQRQSNQPLFAVMLANDLKDHNMKG